MDLNRAKMLAIDCIGYYCKSVGFGFSNSRMNLGLYSYRRNMIYLSKYYVMQNEEDLILDTILHEIAHATVGFGNNHNEVWKRRCIEIGANPKRCKEANLDTTWTGVCPDCNARFEANRRREGIHKGCRNRVKWVRTSQLKTIKEEVMSAKERKELRNECKSLLKKHEVKEKSKGSSMGMSISVLRHELKKYNAKYIYDLPKEDMEGYLKACQKEDEKGKAMYEEKGRKNYQAYND